MFIFGVTVVLYINLVQSRIISTVQASLFSVRYQNRALIPRQKLPEIKI